MTPSPICNHNFNIERGGRGAKEFVGFIGHDIIAMIVAETDIFKT